jgi:hypothetical protein
MLELCGLLPSHAGTYPKPQCEKNRLFLRLHYDEQTVRRVGTGHIIFDITPNPNGGTEKKREWIWTSDLPLPTAQHSPASGLQIRPHRGCRFASGRGDEIVELARTNLRR